MRGRGRERHLAPDSTQDKQISVGVKPQRKEDGEDGEARKGEAFSPSGATCL